MKNSREDVLEVSESGTRYTATDVSDRVLKFAVASIRLVDTFPRTGAAKHIGSQLIRSSTSIGANYEEACAAQSRADFINKVHIAFKETKESQYWLKLANRLDLAPPIRLEKALQEGREIELILGKSLVTAKGVQK